MQSAKCVVVGDDGVGKTCMLITYTCGQFPSEYIPTVFDNYSPGVMIDTSIPQLSLWDTAGRNDYDRLRPLSYPNTDVILLCFSLVDPHSFQSIKTKWEIELRMFISQVPVLLVGTKLDLVLDKNTLESLRESSMNPVTEQQGIDMATEIHAEDYMQCSSLTKEGLKEIFDRACEIAFKKKKNGSCILL